MKTLWNLALLSLFTIPMFFAGAEQGPKPSTRPDYCINSACDVPCPPEGKPYRFKRHAGPCVKETP